LRESFLYTASVLKSRELKAAWTENLDDPYASDRQ